MSLFSAQVWFKNRRAKYRKREKSRTSPPPYGKAETKQSLRQNTAPLPNCSVFPSSISTGMRVFTPLPTEADLELLQNHTHCLPTVSTLISPVREMFPRGLVSSSFRSFPCPSESCRHPFPTYTLTHSSEIPSFAYK